MTPRKTQTTRAKHPWTSFRDNGRDHLADAEAKLVLLSANANADAINLQRTDLRNTSDHGALADM